MEPLRSVDGKLAALACAVLFAAAGVASHAQAPVRARQPGRTGASRRGAAAVAQPPAARPSDYPKVSLTAGRSTVLPTDFDISRIAITNPAIADATVVAAARDPHRRQGARHDQPDRLGADQPHAVRPGRRAADQPLQQHLQMLFPGEDITVGTSDDATILSGQVSSTNVMLRAGEIAQASAAKRSVSTCCRCRAAARASR